MKLLKKYFLQCKIWKKLTECNFFFQSSAKDSMTYFNISVALKHHRGDSNHHNKGNNLGNFSKSHTSANTTFPWITKNLTIFTFHCLEPIIAILSFRRKSNLKKTCNYFFQYSKKYARRPKFEESILKRSRVSLKLHMNLRICIGILLTSLKV